MNKIIPIFFIISVLYANCARAVTLIENDKNKKIIASQFKPREQNFTIPQKELHILAEKDYRANVNTLKLYNELDIDEKLKERIQKIFNSIVIEAKKFKPETSDWVWEIHIGYDGFTITGARAGGKILIGEHKINSMQLNDSELAGLIGHEVAHSTLEHHREELSEFMRINPKYSNLPTYKVLAIFEEEGGNLIFDGINLSHLQEYEADKIGLWLGFMAGYSALEQIGFYKKILNNKPMDNATLSHPKIHTRIQKLNLLVRELESFKQE